MEKQAVIKPGITPVTEEEQRELLEKAGAVSEHAEEVVLKLSDDVVERLSKRAQR